MPKKIFELAKELDEKPLDLVEKLKGLGLNVRNHMSELSDSEVEKVMQELRPQAKTDDDAKKKVIKKKVVKKAPTTKVQTVDSGVKAARPKTEEVDADNTDSKKIKKRVLIRKKGQEGEDELDTSDRDLREQHEYAEEQTLEYEADENADVMFEERSSQEEIVAESQDDVAIEPQNNEQAEIPKDEVQTTVAPAAPVKKAGLRVVAMPTKAPESQTKPAAPASEKSDDKQQAGDKKVYYKEKTPHKFTPVYIPPKAEEKKAVDGQTNPLVDDLDAKPKKKFVDGEEVFEEESEDSKNSKKRLSGLATMMSGKKITTKKDINLSRAEEELKSYATLTSTGRPLYTVMKRKKTYSGPTAQTMITEVKDSKRVIYVHQGCTVDELAQKLSTKYENLRDKVLEINLLVDPSDYVGLALASEIAALYQYRVENRAFNENEIIGKKQLSDEEKSSLPPRNPIITIMGHVDHGKTTLLDYIRKAKVAQGEAGGITQHIGAYSVSAKGKTLTFLDTPGHAAFASMRQRGANVTDIVVLVVAADDGVMPQTRESIRFCQNSQVPIIVAINKMDKEGVNPDRIKNELTEFGITPEEWGGDTQMVPISALKGMGIDELLDSIAILAEMMDLRADNKTPAEGVVIESKVEQGRGPVATILIKSGTLTKGDSIVVGECSGRARSLMDSAGVMLKDAGPSTPVQIIGLDQTPNPGDIMNVVKNEREAKRIVDNRINERKKLEAQPAKKTVSLEDFFSAAPVDGNEQKQLNLIIRADVQGSFEAIRQSLEALTNPEVTLKVIGGGVGAITDNDVALAASSNAFIIGFNMRPVSSARRDAEDKGIDIKTYSIIYELINDVKLAMEGLLDPESVETFIGRAEVRETFAVPKVGTIAGSIVTDGKIQTGCSIRLLRDGKILHDGKLSSLKRFKDDVKEVKNGYECGIGLENYNDIKIGDIFEAYIMEEKRRTLEDVSKAANKNEVSANL